VCSSTALTPILDLGAIPAVNVFPSHDEPSADEARYPLRLCLCNDCGLVLLDEVIPPEALFRTYHYLTSASQPLVEHFAELALECRARGFVVPGANVLDIGANDGTLLHALRQVGARPLGIDPAQNAVEQARQRGIPVLPAFFGETAAEDLATRFGRFDLITCTNVFAHTDGVKAFLAGVRRLLAPGGTVIMEVAHLLDIVVKTQFDSIYHEHVSYLSLRPLDQLFRQCGLEIFDAKKVLTQGGSLRIYARARAGIEGAPSERLVALRREEDEYRIHELATLRRFAEDVEAIRRDLRRLVSEIRQRRCKIVGLGAPAKSVTLLNYCDIGNEDIAYIVDSTPLKQGRYLPGTRIPVRPESALAEDDRPCDYFLLLAWNFQEHILRKIASHRDAGLKVIVPFPRPHVL
jgi:novobiocin biosynthesis protein NovU/D-mycarose 3-C-methyltransferase